MWNINETYYDSFIEYYSETPQQGRARLATEPGLPTSPIAPSSPIKSPPYQRSQHNHQISDNDDSFKCKFNHLNVKFFLIWMFTICMYKFL